MKSSPNLCAILLATAITFLGSGCGDDGPADGGPADTTPPVVTSVTAIDGQHVEVVFDEDVTRDTAEEPANYSIIEHQGARGPRVDGTHDGDPALSPSQTEVVAAARIGGNTVLLSLSGFMANIAYDLLVTKVSDADGNAMTGGSTTQFQGTDAPDTTPPFIVWRTPAPNATGIGTNQTILVVFSEPMQEPTVYAAFRLTSSKGQAAVAMDVWERNQYLISSVVPMEKGTSYTARFHAGAVDYADNPLPETSWSFRTTTSSDVTGPELTSTSPVNGATDVPADAFIELAFSERIDRLSMESVSVTPVPGDGTEEWFDGDRKVRFTPNEPLLANTQYLLVIPKGAVRDFEGNANAESYAVQFTTGSSFASGGMEGTLTGDPFSVQAADPTGALVVATTQELFGPSDDMDVVGIGVTAEDDTFSVERLLDAVYYPFALMDSNNDGVLDPGTGDAVGAYGANLRTGDFTQTPVVIDGGSNAAQVDFPLYDPVTIAGNVIYDGEVYLGSLTSARFWVGAFDATTFDPENPGEPDAGVEGGPLAWDPQYVIHELESGLEPGAYYVGAYLDVNGNGSLDTGFEPSGFYANTQTGEPLIVIVEDGTDELGVRIHLADPQGGMAEPSSAVWRTLSPDDERRAAVRRAFEKIRMAVSSLAK